MGTIYLPHVVLLYDNDDTATITVMITIVIIANISKKNIISTLFVRQLLQPKFQKPTHTPPKNNSVPSKRDRLNKEMSSSKPDCSTAFALRFTDGKYVYVYIYIYILIFHGRKYQCQQGTFFIPYVSNGG